jgi:acetyltransferase-like isoleucine patch superfamily enzyme
MIVQNIQLGNNCDVDPSSSINNIILGDNVKIAKRCSVFGGPDNLLIIGDNTYIGMNTSIIGWSRNITIGRYVSIAQNVNIMSGSGPNNDILQRVFPSHREPVVIGDLCWIGASAIIMPGVTLGKAVIVGANSFVNKSFEDYCVIGGTPAKLIRKLTDEEIKKLQI